MAEDSDKDSKSEEPSEKKIRDTLDKGNVPFSKEVTNVSSMFAIILVGYFYMPTMIVEFSIVLKGLFANIHNWPLDTQGEVRELLHLLSVKLIFLLAPVILPLVVFGLTASLSQNQPRLILNRIAPKFERISLAKGLKRLFGKQTVREFIKSLIKMGGTGMVAAFVLYSQKDFILSLILVEPSQVPAGINMLFLQVAAGLATTMIGLAVIDYIWAQKDWNDDLKMTKQEVKDEHKQSEGDPIVKMRNRSIARDRARRRMISQVGEATLVVANPTHFAVAMRYNPKTDKIPIVLAKGQDLIALKIREIAEKKEIPVFEDPPLARALYKAVRIEKEIPVEFYVPVAKLVRILLDAEKASA